MKRVLFDENLPRRLRHDLPTVDVRTVQEDGWSSLKNGALLAQARHFRRSPHGDQRLQYQQNIPNFDIAVVVIVSRDLSGFPPRQHLLRPMNSFRSRDFSILHTTTSHVDFSVSTTRPIGGTTEASDAVRPFSIQVGDTRFSDDELSPIAEMLKFRPRAAIHAFACSNSAIDHRILAEITLYLVRRFGGIVDFGGDLGRVEATSGWLASVPYECAVPGATLHLADEAFLHSWLSDPRFHMVK